MGISSNQSSAGRVSTTGSNIGIAVSAEPDVAVLTLDDQGMICDCNSAVEALFKFRRNALVGRHVSMVIPQLAEHEVSTNGQTNPYLNYLCRLGHRFRVTTKGGECFASELFFNRIRRSTTSSLLLIVRRVEEKWITRHMEHEIM